MRYPMMVSALLCGAALTVPGCIQPEYPDAFDESFDYGITDAAQAVTASDAGAALPGSPQNPFNPTIPIVPSRPLADAGSAQPIDARTAGALDADVGLVANGAGREAGARLDAASAQEEDAGSVSTAGNGPTRCTITASTDASDTLFYAGKYGCAVWISSASNKLVKAFFVATRVANRTGLPTYKSESAGMTVDVVAGATLGSPKQHQYGWTLTDAQGAAVAPGKYTLKVELHSSNGVELLSVPFDTSSAPVSEKSASGQIRSASIDCE